MKTILACLSAIFFLAACNGGGGSPSGNSGRDGGQGRKGSVTEWQSSLLGQEGHGGDAVVCFSIPVDRAIYKVSVGEPEETCPAPGPCEIAVKPGEGGKGNGSGVVWRMTEEGRQSIRSAKPLEQYLGERIASKKILIDQLNQMPLEEGYQKILLPFAKLPAAFKRISEMHQKLGWLHEDGISSEYGLMDVNDSGFVGEHEIDTVYCKELQAVVRRDNQLWYDADIVRHFDNAGRVLIQLHEEIYAWGKQQDQINKRLIGIPAHDNSIKTRHLILKILNEGLDQKLANENLKSLGFSTMFWENKFNLPTSVGYYMDTDSCLSEQQFLKEFFRKDLGYGRDAWLNVELLFSPRYVKTNVDVVPELRHNFPEALSNMIALVYKGNSSTFASEIRQLQSVFERPESCQGSF